MSGKAAYHSSDAGDRVDRKAALVNKLQTQHDMTDVIWSQLRSTHSGNIFTLHVKSYRDSHTFT